MSVLYSKRASARWDSFISIIDAVDNGMCRIAEGSLIASCSNYVDAASLEPKMFREARSSRGYSLFFCFTELFLHKSFSLS